MPLSISCPPDAQLALRDLIPTYPPHSIEAITSAFLRESGITERRVRELALAKQLPLSGVLRILILKKYPQIAPLWPKPAHTRAQVEGFAARSRSPLASQNTTLKHLALYVNREETGRGIKAAKDHLLANGYELLEDKYVLRSK